MPEQRVEIVKKVAELIDERYVFREVGAQVRRRLEQRLAEGAYDGLEDAEAFCQAVTEEMQAVSRDGHMRLRRRNPSRATVGAGRADREDLAIRKQRQNYGFARVERLDGNVGYLDLREFHHPDSPAGQVAVAAMQFLGHADALIFDMRKCPGGSGAMVALLTAYLFDGPPVHLNSVYDREGEEVFQSWTPTWVPGKRLPKVPVYVLTSGYTFSAGEEFTYSLKHLKRATVVGERTRGGANPGANLPVGHDMVLFVSDGRAQNPISGDNWEGKGVEPDMAVPADQALTVAYAEALKQIIEKARSHQGGAWESLAQEAETALRALG